MSEKITLQKIFDLAWEHFIVGDGEPAFDSNSGCSYETPDGRKCAVGLALPPHPKGEDYEYEGSFGAVVAKLPELFASSVLRISYDNLCHFQNMLHDRLIDSCSGEWNGSKEDLKASYLEVAQQFNLTVPNH